MHPWLPPESPKNGRLAQAPSCSTVTGCCLAAPPEQHPHKHGVGEGTGLGCFRTHVPASVMGGVFDRKETSKNAKFIMTLI